MSYLLKTHEIFPLGGRKQEAATLLKDDEPVLSITYDVLLHTARLESHGSKRLFLVYEEGKRQPRTVFKNEYGFDTGTIDPILTDADHGSLKLHEKQYYYNLSAQAEGSLYIYESVGSQPLIQVQIEVLPVGIVSYSSSHHLQTDYFNCLLMALCWYLQLPVKESALVAASFVSSNNPAIQMGLR
jgi:hypothetical protein